MRLLLVEDHAALRELLEAHLAQRGNTVRGVPGAAAALEAAAAEPFDAVVLDLGLPDGDGLDVLRSFRAGPVPDLPILVLTARAAVESRVAGLDAGADDYLAKPFDLQEFDARLRAITRRVERRREVALDFAALSLDASIAEVSVSGRRVEITRREFALLEALVRAQGHAVVRERMEELLFGADASGGIAPHRANALDAAVSRLRRRLSRASAAVCIETVRGIGYRLAPAPVPAADASR